MFARIIHRATLIAVVVLLSHRLALALGRYEAIAVWVIGIGLACFGASLLLRTAPLGRITWKNRLAGYFLPWGSSLGNGQLPRIVLISWLVWSLIGSETIVVTTHATEGISEVEKPTSTALMLLLTAWIGNGLALMYCLGVLVRNFDLGSKSARTLLKIIAVLTFETFASSWLLLLGYPWWAVAVAGGPLVLVGGIMGSFLLMVMIFGRNARWN